MRLAVIKKCAPQLKITVFWDCGKPSGTTELYVRRVGENMEFAAYPALEVNGGEILFQFDDLLFIQPVGVFEGRLLVGGIEQAKVRFWYTNATRVLSTGNARC